MESIDVGIHLLFKVPISTVRPIDVVSSAFVFESEVTLAAFLQFDHENWQLFDSNNGFHFFGKRVVAPSLAEIPESSLVIRFPGRPPHTDTKINLSAYQPDDAFYFAIVSRARNASGAPQIHSAIYQYGVSDPVVESLESL